MVPKSPHCHINLLSLLFIEALQGRLRSWSCTRKKERIRYTSLFATIDVDPLIIGFSCPIDSLPIMEVSNLYLALFSLCSLMACKADAISTVTLSGHLSQTTTSLQATLARWYFNLFMPPNIWVEQKLQMTLWSSSRFTRTQYFHAESRGLLPLDLDAMESEL